MSWAWARKMLALAAEAVTLGEIGGLVGAKAGPLGDPEPADDAEPDAVAGALAWLEADVAAELLDELQAVTSKAAQASTAQIPQPVQPVQPAPWRVLRPFVANMDFIPKTPNIPNTPQFLSGSVSRPTHTTSAAPPWLGAALREAETTARSA